MPRPKKRNSQERRAPTVYLITAAFALNCVSFNARTIEEVTAWISDRLTHREVVQVNVSVLA